MKSTQSSRARRRLSGRFVLAHTHVHTHTLAKTVPPTFGALQKWFLQTYTSSLSILRLHCPLALQGFSWTQRCVVPSSALPSCTRTERWTVLRAQRAPNSNTSSCLKFNMKCKIPYFLENFAHKPPALAEISATIVIHTQAEHNLLLHCVEKSHKTIFITNC